MSVHLPGILAEIAEIAGIDAACAVAEARGGIRADIPAKAGDDHWLVEAVGREAADRICEHFRILDADNREKGLRHHIIPLGPASLLAKAKVRFQTEIDAGRSVREAARIAGVCERTGWRWQAKEADDRQGQLFDL